MIDPLLSSFSVRPLRTLYNVVQDGFHTLFQLLFLSLLLLGLGGLVFKAVRPGGWLEVVFSHAWAASPAYALFGTLALVAATIWARRSAAQLSVFNRRGEWLVYGCLALGAFFAVQLVATGTL